MFTTEWHIPGLLPKHDVITLDGANGVGKTLVAAHLLHRFAKLDNTRALYCYTEEQEEAGVHFTTVLEALTENLLAQKLSIPPAESGEKPICLLEPLVLVLDRFLTEMKPTLCIVDGFDDLMAHGSDLPAHEAMRLWRALRDLAAEKQCTIVIIRHKGLHETRLYGNVSKSASRGLRHGLTMHWHPYDKSKRIITVARRQFGPPGDQFHLTMDAQGQVSLRQAFGNMQEAPAHQCRTWKHNLHDTKLEKAALSIATEFMEDSIMPLHEVQQMLQRKGLPGRVIHRVLARGQFGIRHDNGECYLTPPKVEAQQAQTDQPKVDSTFAALKPAKPYSNLAEVAMKPAETLVASRRKSMTDNNIPRATSIEKPAEVSQHTLAG